MRHIKDVIMNLRTRRAEKPKYHLHRGKCGNGAPNPNITHTALHRLNTLIREKKSFFFQMDLAPKARENFGYYGGFLRHFVRENTNTAHTVAINTRLNTAHTTAESYSHRD